MSPEKTRLGNESPVAADEAAVLGVAYVRIPAPGGLLQEVAEFYKAVFGMQQIGGILDHAIMLNAGATVEEALANKNTRVIIDKRMKSNQGFALNDNNCWVFVTKGVEHIIQRAREKGAPILMQPYPPLHYWEWSWGNFAIPLATLSSCLKWARTGKTSS